MKERPPSDNWLFPVAMDAALPLDDTIPADAPLDVDLGFGMGRFLIARAAANPGTYFLGIDQMIGRVRKVDRHIVRAGVQNVRLLRAEAMHSLQIHLPRKRVRTLYIHFPDPWPKRRHHRRRLFAQPHFLDALEGLLIPGGSVQIATDHEDYFQHMQRVMDPDPRFNRIPPTPRAPDEWTNFELIFRGRGEPVYETAYELL